MVHRASEEDSPREEAPPVRSFPSSLSRQTSHVESNNGYCEEEFIYYRPPNKNYFQGPFTEVDCQFWYKECHFYNSLEFRFGRDGPIETLESLKARNGRECPFQEGAKKAPYNDMMVKTLMARVFDLGSDLAKVKEESAALQIARKIEIDSLTNRVKELMEDKTRNEEYRRCTDLQLSQMQSQLAELKFSMGVPTTAVTAPSSNVVTNEHDITICQESKEDVVTERTAVPHSIADEDESSYVRSELERLNSNMHSLDKFTFKLSHKVEKLKQKEAAVHKVIGAIGEGLNSRNGVFDRLAYVEASVEEMQSVVWPGGEGRGEKKKMKEEKKIREEEKRGPTEEEMKEEVVQPVERVEMRLDQISSPPEVWFSPNDKFATTPPGFELLPPPHKTSFTAVADSITAVAMAAWPGGLETTTPVKGVQVDDWESIGVAVPPSDAPWREEEVKEEVKNEAELVESKSEEEEEEETSEEVVLPPHEQQSEEEATTSDKENLATKMDGAAGMLELIGNGLGMLLQCSESDCEDNAADADIDRLLAAIKGAKMLQIAESLNHHFAKALVCDVCSTGAKKAELRNAIEYFEHLNRAHFKKCGGADKMVVNQFAFLLEQFKAAIPVPLSISKRQFTERQKKPWMKNKEALSTPTGKTTGKKKK